jgi:hypothetical protein
LRTSGIKFVHRQVTVNVPASDAEVAGVGRWRGGRGDRDRRA